MRVVPCTLFLACLLAGFSGCQLFDKKSGGGDTPFLGDKTADKGRPAKPSDPLIGGAGGITELESILTGKVIDAMGGPADAEIRCVCMDGAKEDDAPISVAVNAQGYFMIKGLKTGKHYKLTTHAKSGDKTLEVVTLTEVPNVNLLIQVREGFAVPASPDKGKGKKPNIKDAPTSIPNPGWPGSSMVPPPPPLGDRSRIADQSSLTMLPPTVDVPGGRPPIKLPPPLPESAYSASPPPPFSLLVGTRLENFALYDLNLKPWELRKERRGKLVLLDFWKTNCPPCLQTIAELRILDKRYGPNDLQVIGIAYEDAGTLQAQASDVAAVADQRQAQYQILLGGGPQCQLWRDLKVRYLPTLVLLDENGTIVWQHEGLLDAVSKEELKFNIESRLRTP